MSASKGDPRYAGLTDDALELLAYIRLGYAKYVAEKFSCPLEQAVRVVTELHEKGYLIFRADQDNLGVFEVVGDYERIDAFLQNNNRLC